VDSRTRGEDDELIADRNKAVQRRLELEGTKELKNKTVNN